MKRIDDATFLSLVQNCDKIEDQGKTKDDNRTRRGHYVSILLGLSSTSWFVGLDLTTREYIIEQVG